MIALKNIKRNNNVIRCEFYPEDSVQPGRLIVDLNDHKVISTSYPQGYEWCHYHVSKAVRYLLNSAEDMPKTRVISWG